MIPPINAVAIGPKKLLRNKGISARTAAAAVRVIGRKRRTVGADDSLEATVPGADVLLDLVHQDHGVAHDDAEHRDRSEQRHETERLMKKSSNAITTPISPSGAVSTTISTRLKLCSCIINSTRNGDEQNRHLRVDRALGLRVFLHGAADLDAIADGQLLSQ